MVLRQIKLIPRYSLISFAIVSLFQPIETSVLKNTSTNWRILILCLFMSQSTNFWGQTVKGFYIDGFQTILGNPLREDSLLRFAKNNGFNYLMLYNLHNINTQHPLTNISTSAVLANFIYKAKTQFDIAEIGGASENFEFLRDVIHVYNEQHPNPLEKIDVYNLEFEWWNAASVDTGGYYCQYYLAPNGDTCSVDGAFNYYTEMLFKIDSMANSAGHKSEAYLGWFDDPQGAGLINAGVDRILLHIYMPSVNFNQNSQYNYVDDRLRSLGLANQPIKVLPLYSSEPSFMQTWVTTNDFFTPFNLLEASLQNETASWKSTIQLEGIQWFTYSDMPRKNMDLSVAEISRQFSVFQDWTANSITIQNTTDSPVNYQYQLVDLSGNSVMIGTQDNPVIGLNPFASGSYILRIQSAGATSNFRFVK